MGKYDALVQSIVNNPGEHIVNREEKMDRTLDIMCQNLERSHSKRGNKRVLSEAEINKGYGAGRKMGD